MLPFIVFLSYREVRSSTLEKSLSSLGVEKLSRDEVQKLPWESLETKIGNWIHHMRIAVRIYEETAKLFDFLFWLSNS